ncbi:rnd family efflux transporter mfp subunit : RND family efflux transporter, MFP subunit OS=Singulisphaera acidiphila (strain ATCC BAA-1392 / DSM 18658 / VKM B-2454 / MOB10) GN=Sinac_0100 PE=4 SV=1: HlyD [Gemmataceae bacterium]|nr:rnd family efflux transporter mfp subunit : RND family efflux transporter, MFP subunit OS=Singulisphaera acidiphila (strain ATCC BAA-1392 / DSM 18658 / VKM B-2454 / MOB10) GN=Sinac_0100 PE=4 SV=1: HlyD [Gemmataceae bacterium]VTT98885.1 rnd family efflux transporter mfp subunit : RND family efflux transporter, MFP subunit OS=Singulisphaera acidiphila (strain ATCC BAA-1392 / DSM 18658 / VKM B-2454 / MOB10) GN=Sinac_0100 PE=4 SV=1: HlyD [Gemmataceae bacterium]
MNDSPDTDHRTDPTAGGPTHHARPAHRPSGRTRRRLVGGALVFVTLAGGVAAAAVLTGFLPNPIVAGDPKATGLTEPREAAGPLPVKVVTPKRDPNFRISIRRVAVIEPYHQAGLRARVSGVVRSVTKDIGDPVRAGEVLAEIDVPDLRQAVEQKDAIIHQREKELAASRADLAVARSAVDAATVAVKFKAIEVTRARDLRTARKLELDQWAILYRGDAAVKARVDAATLEYQAADRAFEISEVDVEKARVELTGKAASLEKSAADIELKQALVEVARRDRDAALVQLGYTRLHAPFDGVVVARSTDPGRFVFGASAEPLVTVARTDLVTVAAKVPDSAAPFVSWDTEALVEFAQLPGVTVRGRITRYSHAIDPADQTMRVEVDVYNGTQAEYRAMLARSAVKSTLAPLIPLDSTAAVVAAGAGLIRSKADHKGWHEGEALTPDWGPDGHYRRIVAGTTATVRLDLEKFGDSHLLPSGAVYGRAGQSYILLVENGVTRQVPVVVQMNDGRLVKVALVVTSGSQQLLQELSGTEVVVATRQLEVGEGRKVATVPEKW